MPYQRGVVDQTGRASSDVIPEWNASIDEGQGGSIDASAQVAAVGLKNFHENVDLRPR